MTTLDGGTPEQIAAPRTERGQSAATTHPLRPMLRGPIGMLGPRIRDFLHRGHTESAQGSPAPSVDIPPASEPSPGGSPDESGGS